MGCTGSVQQHEDHGLAQKKSLFTWCICRLFYLPCTTLEHRQWRELNPHGNKKSPVQRVFCTAAGIRINMCLVWGQESYRVLFRVEAGLKVVSCFQTPGYLHMVMEVSKMLLFSKLFIKLGGDTSCEVLSQGKHCTGKEITSSETCGKQLMPQSEEDH